MSSNNCDNISGLSMDETGIIDDSKYYSPPPPQPKYSKFERLRHLESYVMIRRAEIESLKQRKYLLTVDLAEKRSKILRGKQINDWGIPPNAIDGKSDNRKYLKNDHNESHMTVDQSDFSNDTQQKDDNNNINNNNNNNEKEKKMKRYDISDDPTNPLNNPIMRFVDSTLKNGCDLSRDVPPWEVGNLCTEFDVATDQFVQHTKILKKTINELELQVKQSEKNQCIIEKRIQTMANITGMMCKGPEEKTAVYNNKNKKRKSSTAPAMKAMREIEEAAAAAREAQLRGEEPGANAIHPVLRAKQTITKLQMAINTTNKELHTAKVNITAKQKAAVALQMALKKKQETEKQLMDINNKIKVKEREVKEKKQTLLELMEEHERADREIDVAAKIPTVTLQPLKDNLKEIKDSLKHTREEEEKAQERVVKAQEFRIRELQKRLLSVNQSISSHSYTKSVDAIMAGSCQHEEDTRLNKKEQSLLLDNNNNNNNNNSTCTTPINGNTPARRAIQRRVDVLSSISTPNNNNNNTFTPNNQEASSLGSAISTTTLVGTSQLRAIAIAIMPQEDLYDIDTIIPKNEKIHPAIYGLFFSEFEKLSVAVSKKKILLQEKKQTYNILCNVVDNHKGEHYEVTEDAVYYANRAHYDEEIKKHKLVRKITDQRQYLRDLVQKKEKIIKEIKSLNNVSTLMVPPSSANTSTSRH